MSTSRSASADLSRRCVPRGRPRLRVVGAARDHVRHITYFRVAGSYYSVEFWTFGEWAKLHPAERPRKDQFSVVPGAGYVALVFASDETVREIGDIHEQWAAMTGP